MKDLEEKIKKIEESIKKIEKRNQKVEKNKSWETSNFRKISVAVVTYFTILIIMYLLNFTNIFINALIPTSGYLLSTLSMNILRKFYIKKQTSYTIFK